MDKRYFVPYDTRIVSHFMHGLLTLASSPYKYYPTLSENTTDKFLRKHKEATVLVVEYGRLPFSFRSRCDSMHVR